MAAPTKTSQGVKPPTTEQGYATLQPFIPNLTWGVFAAGITEDEVPDLRWPNSVRIYHQMRTDSQVDALMKAITLPLRRRRWVIDPNGASDEAVEQIASDFGLPVKGTDEVPERGRHKFNHDDHLRHALLGLAYGHMFMEKVGEIDENMNWRLQKLAPRMPQSIRDVLIDQNGDLEGIVQWGKLGMARPGPGIGNPFGNSDPIKSDWLAPYVWDREGANWVGRSLLRPLYKHWLLKDRIMRIDAMRHEKLGLGIPYAEAPKGASESVVKEYGDMAAGIRANPDAGYGIAAGAKIGVEGPPRGSLPDTIASIKYHDESMARDFLAMFMQLGTTESGSRALGMTFSDFFQLSEDAIAEWYCDITNESVIELIIDWNYGADEGTPLIAWEDKKDDPLAVDELVTLIDNGLIEADEDIRAWTRQNWDLPEPTDPNSIPKVKEAPTTVQLLPAADVTETTPAAEATPAAAKRGIRARAQAHAHARMQTYGQSGVGHRVPTPVEAASGTDFAAIQQAWEEGTSSLIDDWAAIQSQQIDAVVEAIRGAVTAQNVTALASLSAPVLGADVIGDHMMAIAEDAITQARDEAAKQNVTIELVNVADLEPVIRARAEAVAALMARSLSQSAANQALMRYGVTDLTADAVATAVRSHLESLSDSFQADTLGGALTQAQNSGRYAVMSQRPAKYYASELLDMNTCSVCEAIDGREYDTVDAAQQDYPAGGYSECLGGPRCRGTLVAVYEESEAST